MLYFLVMANMTSFSLLTNVFHLLESCGNYHRFFFIVLLLKQIEKTKIIFTVVSRSLQ